MRRAWQDATEEHLPEIGESLIATASMPLLAQVYSLPILFGVLSQAVAYRRERGARAE